MNWDGLPIPTEFTVYLAVKTETVSLNHTHGTKVTPSPHYSKCRRTTDTLHLAMCRDGSELIRALVEGSTSKHRSRVLILELQINNKPLQLPRRDSGQWNSRQFSNQQFAGDQLSIIASQELHHSPSMKVSHRSLICSKLLIDAIDSTHSEIYFQPQPSLVLCIIQESHLSNCFSFFSSVVHSTLRTRVFPRPAPSLFVFPGIGSKPIYDTESDTKIFQRYSDVLTKNYDLILNEYQSALKRNNNVIESDYALNNDEHKLNNGEWLWNSYILKGKVQSKFSDQYPETVKILESFLSEKPKLMSETPFSYAFFSTLRKESKINPHYGPCNLRIRCHFPLIVPKGDCGMKVGDKIIKWEEGVPIFFDDCYEHHGKCGIIFSSKNAMYSNRIIFNYIINLPFLASGL